MRKFLSLILCAAMLLSCVAVATADEAVKTGMALSISLSSSSSATAEKNGTAQTNVTAVAVTVDANGVITNCIIDAIQAKIQFNANGEIVTDPATLFNSKLVLGDAYGMRPASPIGKEWNEQAEGLAAYCVGKTVEEILATPVNERGVATGADLTSTCTIPATPFFQLVAEAAANAKELGATTADKLVLTQVTSIGKANNATESANGATQAYTTIGAFTLNGETITSAWVDAIQGNVAIDAKGQIVTDITAPVLSKNALGDAYGMRPASKIGKEWNEQASAYAAFITGKTISEVLATGMNEGGYPTDADLTTGCTMKINALQTIVELAGK